MLVDAALRSRAWSHEGAMSKDKVRYSTQRHAKRRQRLKDLIEAPTDAETERERAARERRVQQAARLRRQRRDGVKRVPTALAAAQSLRPELDWREQPRPRATPTPSGCPWHGGMA